MQDNILQKVFVNSGPSQDKIFEEIVAWAESAWWPQGLPMQIERISGQPGKDALYLQRAKVIFGPKWRTKEAIVDPGRKYLKKVFLDGVFKGGYEEVFIDFEGGRKVCYNFSCNISNPVFRLAWNLGLKKMHKKSISRILQALKKYIEER